MSRFRRKRFDPHVEGLDPRCLLSIAGLTPAQIETAYGLGGLTFGSQAANGAGQTIAIVDAYSDPNIQTELATFDAATSLPAPPSLTVMGVTGQTTALPRPDAGWAQEEALDVEWAHALAPGAAIVLVEANSGGIPDLMAAVQTAARIPGVSVVTMSWSGSEGLYFSPAYDAVFTAPGITFVAASGDNGAFGGVQYPASSPNVVSVGGTSLQVLGDGTYQFETPWFGSSGGISIFEQEPSYQQTMQSSGWRTTPDVAFDGNPYTGVEVYSVNPNTGQGRWLSVAGTSLGAQAWGAIIAVVDQGRALAGAPALSSLQTLQALYNLPGSDFHTVGSSYNTQTGLGSPNGAALIDDLVVFNPSAQPDSESTTISTPPPSTPPLKGQKKHHHKKAAGHAHVKPHPVKLKVKHPQQRAALKH